MKNKTETQELLSLMKRLTDERDMIGWLCTVHLNAVEYENNLGATEKIQQQLNRANTLISLAYIWALLEEAGFDENNKWISSADRNELKAWKHIRHTGAHAPSGRAKRYKSEFDSFMSSSENGKSGLKQNCTFTNNSIGLADGMNWKFFEFIQSLIQVAVAHCAENDVPN